MYENLKTFQNKKSLFSSIITGDESWFFLENKKLKKNKKEWRNPNDTPSKIPSTKLIDKRYLFSIFFCSQGLISLRFLE